MGLCGAQGGPPLGSGTNAILCNSWISSAMAMVMSIYGTLCALVLKTMKGQKGIEKKGNNGVNMFH